MTLQDKLKSISLSFLQKEALTLSDSDPKAIAIGMAGGLLFHIFGREWMAKKIFTQKYLASLFDKANDELSEFKFQKQILILSESLYNLRETEGIQNVLDRLKNERIESITAELESGRLLFHRGLNFKFVTTIQKKRNDFDIHIVNGSNEIFCETKCKIESTTFSRNSIINSLSDAKDQLPKDYPAIILIKLPDHWGKFKTDLNEIISTFVNKTYRPLGIICWYDKWDQVDNVNSKNITVGLEAHNDKSKIYNAGIIPFLPSTMDSISWKHFENFAKGYL